MGEQPADTRPVHQMARSCTPHPHGPKTAPSSDTCRNGVQIPRPVSLAGVGIQLTIEGIGVKETLCFYVREQDGIQIYADPMSPMSLSIKGDQCHPVAISPGAQVDPYLEVRVSVPKATREFSSPSLSTSAEIPHYKPHYGASCRRKRSRVESDSDGCELASDGDTDSDGSINDESNSDSEGNRDSDAEGCSMYASKVDDGPLPRICTDNAFEGLREGLLHLASSRAWAARANFRYGSPPGDGPRCRKSTRAQLRSVFRGEHHQEDATRLQGFFHLSCPYYKQDPFKFRDCLRGGSLESIKDVIGHLQRHHRMLPYCPVCRKSFQASLERDAHALGRTCQPNTHVLTGGLSERELAKLAKRDRRGLDERARWLRIWSAVFLDAEPPPSPYLEHNVGLDASIIRDLWVVNGKELITEFLDDRFGHSPRLEELMDERAIQGLFTWTLRHLMNESLEKGHGHDVDTK